MSILFVISSHPRTIVHRCIPSAINRNERKLDLTRRQSSPIWWVRERENASFRSTARIHRHTQTHQSISFSIFFLGFYSGCVCVCVCDKQAKCGVDDEKLSILFFATAAFLLLLLLLPPDTWGGVLVVTPVCGWVSSSLTCPCARVCVCVCNQDAGCAHITPVRKGKSCLIILFHSAIAPPLVFLASSCARPSRPHLLRSCVGVHIHPRAHKHTQLHRLRNCKLNHTQKQPFFLLEKLRRRMKSSTTNSPFDGPRKSDRAATVCFPS